MHFDESKMKKQRLRKGDPYSIQPDIQHIQKQKVDELTKLAKQYQKYQKAFKDQKFFSRDQYYLICSKWLRRWKVYVSYNEVIKQKYPNKVIVNPTQMIGCGKLPKANQSIIQSIYYGSLQFQGNLSYLRIKLKGGLQQGQDYQFISKQMFECLQTCKDYQMNKIIRKVVKAKDGNKVQLYPFSFKVIILFNDHCKIIERNQFQKFIQAHFQFSLYQKVQDFGLTLQNYFKQTVRTAYKQKVSSPPTFSTKINPRIWLLNSQIEKNIYFNILREACKKNLNYDYKIYFDGQILQKQKYLCDYQINETTYVVIQLRESGQQDWIFFNDKCPLEANCPQCRKKKLLKVFCSCKQISYCSQQCKKQHKQSHKGRCPNEAESDDEETKKLVLVQQSKKGIVGLRNLGNTCFMNSGLQCISNIAQLRDYFLKDSYIKDINKINKLGTKGQLSTSFAKMVQKMWFGTDSYFSPTKIKTAIAKFQPMFSGYNQHDSGQLINYLLDGLHEDLNRIKQRPYIQIKDYDGRPDQIVANQVWNIFLKRNQSIIVDLMYGQYKSIVDCPKCTFKSIQFDPFLMLSLPLCNANKKTIKVIYLKNHFQEKLVKITYFISKKPTFKFLHEEIRRQQNLQKNKKLIAFIGSSSKCKFIPQDTDLDSYISQIYYSRIYIRQQLNGQDYEKDNHIAIYNAAKYTYSSSRRTFAAPRLYFFHKKMTLQEIHLFIGKLCYSMCPFKNYEKQIYKQEKSEKPYQILYQTGKSARKCQICDSKRCQGCQLKFNDDKLPEERQITTAIQLHVEWLKDYKQVKTKIQQLQVPDERDDNDQKQSGIQLDQCLNLFKEPETLAQDNAWYCPKCKQFVLANKQMSIYKPPKILLITLKRFKRRGYSSDKNNVVVNYPITGLDLSSYVASYGANKKNAKVSRSKVQDGMIYDLIGVSNHFGSTGGGHYTAYCKNSSTNLWYEFDDSSVQKIKDQNKIVSKAGYVLFYRRRQ